MRLWMPYRTLKRGTEMTQRQNWLTIFFAGIVCLSFTTTVFARDANTPQEKERSEQLGRLAEEYCIGTEFSPENLDQLAARNGGTKNDLSQLVLSDWNVPFPNGDDVNVMLLESLSDFWASSNVCIVSASGINGADSLDVLENVLKKIAEERGLSTRRSNKVKISPRERNSLASWRGSVKMFISEDYRKSLVAELTRYELMEYARIRIYYESR
ncbi:MAG TPA: hypothetical protein DCL95_02820 [Rhodospirillaceae bacterium]|nr:hypothetical protein [Rhodospirillaceae bacterium]MAX63137.1 hypothetical protein [Rhodospirillaceae bacterium]MAX64564.1 hypothetical protein [Rhodospirillaceae bacterium]MBB58472.1 hypothetical protein [Rhodospirillaceae bacterium]HAE01574.1 hypothetical protein [Rhodospirillaceae bacterium]